MKPSNSKITSLCALIALGVSFLSGCCAPKGVLYWSMVDPKNDWGGGGGHNGIMRAGPEGDPAPAMLIETRSEDGKEPRVPAGIAVDLQAQRVYWAEPESREIKFASMRGGKAENLATGPTIHYPVAVALDAASHRLYWAESGVDDKQGHIKYAYTDGRTPNTPREIYHSTSISGVGGVALETTNGARRIYWHTAGGKLQSLDMDGTEKTPIDFGLPEGSSTQAGGLAYVPSQHKFYWADYGVSAVGWATIKDGKVSEHSFFVVSDPWPVSVFADIKANRLYWGFRSKWGAVIQWKNLTGDPIIHSLPIQTNATGIEVVYPR